MKELLTNAPILMVPEGNHDLVVYTDACGSGLGAVLMQKIWLEDLATLFIGRALHSLYRS